MTSPSTCELADPRINLLENIDLASLKVNYSASPIILLCGGYVAIKDRAEDSEPCVSSLRHAVNLEAITFHLDSERENFVLFRPEEIEDWATDGLFKHLMDFEKELASVSSLVVIILESAGAIAELGAFSQLHELSKKLIVFKSDHFGEDVSFIDLGILRYIKSDFGQNRVKKYSWVPSDNKKKAAQIEDGTPNDVLHDISDEVKRLKKTSKFKGDYDTHITALICELLSMFIALKETEILTYLKILRLDVNRDRLRRKLFILRWFDIVDKSEVSDSIYYFRTQEAFHSINGFHTADGVVDKLRQTTLVAKYYRDKKDRHRNKAIAKTGLLNE